MFALAALCALCAADAPGGWPELFPRLGNYNLKLGAPIFCKGDKPEVYSQAATYDWLGGRFESLTVTLARDPAFQEMYSAEGAKKTLDGYEAIEVNKKRAYLLPRNAATEKKVTIRLVVVLADDKVLIVEQRGFGMALPDVAKMFNFEKVEKALASPPPAAKKE